MSMTRKDYVMLTETIRNSRIHVVPDEGSNAVINMVAQQIADQLERNNKAFDRDRFLKDCGVA